MTNQRQLQLAQTNGPKTAPFLVLGAAAAALMIQGLLVPLPVHAHPNSESMTAVTIANANSNLNDASASHADAPVLTFHHNLQLVTTMSTGGSGPAGAGPQLLDTSAMASHSNAINTSSKGPGPADVLAPAVVQDKQEIRDKVATVMKSSAKIASVVDSPIVEGSKVEAVGKGLLVNQVNSVHSREAKPIVGDAKQITEIIEPINDMPALASMSGDDGSEITEDINEVHQDNDQVVFAENDEEALGSFVDKSPTSATITKSTELNMLSDLNTALADVNNLTTKPLGTLPKSKDVNINEEIKENDNERLGGEVNTTEKGNQVEIKTSNETSDEEKYEINASVASPSSSHDDSKSKSQRDQAIARLQEQLLNKPRQKQASQADTVEPETLIPDNTTDENDATTFARAVDFVPQEDMRAVINAKTESDQKEGKVQTPLTPQQIVDTEHQGANAFFELFAADVFPNLKLIGNNQIEDTSFEQRLHKQKANKAKAMANKESKRHQGENSHQNSKRADAPEQIEKERVHVQLEHIFGKEKAAEVEAEADESVANYRITAQGPHANTAFAGDAGIDREGDIITGFDQDIDDEPIGIKGVSKKSHTKKKHHHKPHVDATNGSDIYATGIDVMDVKDDTMDTKDTKDAKDPKDAKDDKKTVVSPPDAMKPGAGGPPDRAALGPVSGQPNQHPQQATSGSTTPSPPPPKPVPATDGAAPSKGGNKDAAGTAEFGTVPMFGPAQLDLGNSAGLVLASRGSIGLTLILGIVWLMIL
ncbi:hypothetical protein FBU30_002111 [Linnemannia zychae]|nr:hypothetical protein FBU30_002111 [Linnemannia zychae]